MTNILEQRDTNFNLQSLNRYVKSKERHEIIGGPRGIMGIQLNTQVFADV
jgi:hypothetical protein